MKKKPRKPMPGKLRTVWDRKKRELKLTQVKAARFLGFRSQSAVAQYLNGQIPLGLEAALGFAALLKCDLSEIYDEPMPSALPTTGEALRADLLRRSRQERMELVRIVAEIESDPKAR